MKQNSVPTKSDGTRFQGPSVCVNSPCASDLKEWMKRTVAHAADAAQKGPYWYASFALGLQPVPWNTKRVFTSPWRGVTLTRSFADATAETASTANAIAAKVSRARRRLTRPFN